MSGDGAYDTRASHYAIMIKRAVALVPPREGTTFWEHGYPRNLAVGCQKLYGSNKYWKERWLPVCFGAGQTMTLSKMANCCAKVDKNQQRVCIIDSEEQRLHYLAMQSASEVWGIGRKLIPRLT